MQASLPIDYLEPFLCFTEVWVPPSTWSKSSSNESTSLLPFSFILLSELGREMVVILLLF
jgi:hypothetical protein